MAFRKSKKISFVAPEFLAPRTSGVSDVGLSSRDSDDNKKNLEIQACLVSSKRSP